MVFRNSLSKIVFDSYFKPENFIAFSISSVTLAERQFFFHTKSYVIMQVFFPFLPSADVNLVGWFFLLFLYLLITCSLRFDVGMRQAHIFEVKKGKYKIILIVRGEK